MKYAPYKWIITHDHFADPTSAPGTNDNAVGLEGPWNCDPSITADQLPDKFRMYDDDDELYYEGVCNCLTNDHPHVDGFEPLDNLGAPNAGCTRIDYYNPKTGAWEIL